MNRMLVVLCAVLTVLFGTSAHAQELDGKPFRMVGWVGDGVTYPATAVEYMMPVLSSLGTQGLATGLVLTPHREESPTGATYGQICNIITTANSNATETFALYEIVNGLPTAKIWEGPTVSLATSGVKCSTFSSGTWSTYGAANFKDANDNLVLTAYASIAKGRLKSHLNSERYISTPRVIGIDPSLDGTMWSGWVTSTAADPLDPEDLAAHDGRLPYLPLIQTAPAE